MDRRQLLKILFSLPWASLFRSLGHAVEFTIDISSLDKPWSSLEFRFPAKGTNEETVHVPGIAIRLPAEDKEQGSLFVASRICPHQACELLYFTDPNQVQEIFRIKIKNPVLACPCHLSVFDLSQDGKVLNGPAPRPPFRFRFSTAGKRLMVLDLEK